MNAVPSGPPEAEPARSAGQAHVPVHIRRARRVLVALYAVGILAVVAVPVVGAVLLVTLT